MTVLGLDMSNYLRPNITKAWVERCRDELNIRWFAVQGLNLNRHPSSQTRQQCETILAVKDVKLVGYVYPFFDNSVNEISDRIDSLAPFFSQMADFYLDLEDVSSAKSANQEAAITDTWLDICDQAIDYEAGVYTGAGVWDEMGFAANLNRWANRKLWWAAYDNVQSTSIRITRGGWSKCLIHQFRGSATNIFGYTGIDYNALDDEYWQSLQGTTMQVPQDYQDKFGCGPDDWNCVTANLEGIIDSLNDQLAGAPADLQEKLTKAKMAIAEMNRVLLEYANA